MPKDHAVQWDDDTFDVLSRAAKADERPIGAQIRHYVRRCLKQDGLLPAELPSGDDAPGDR